MMCVSLSITYRIARPWNLARGWSSSESGDRWTTGESASLELTKCVVF